MNLFCHGMGLICLFAGRIVSAATPVDRVKLGLDQPMDPALRPALAEVADEVGLPRVLLIGDSISIGYTLKVREQLQGRANVHRPGENGGPTVFGLERLDGWLGNGPWAVIHFNFGLHDLKYLDERGGYATPDKGRVVATPEVYASNLSLLVQRLRRTGARLIFATTTPVPAGSNARIEGSEARYNEAALKVMRENGVAIDDLHAYALAHQAEIQLPHNVHFTPAGSDRMAALVVSSIETALKP